MSVPRFDGSVNDQNISLEYFGTLHRVAFDREEERRNRVGHQEVIDVETLLFVIRGRRREAGRHFDGVNRKQKGVRQKGCSRATIR